MNDLIFSPQAFKDYLEWLAEDKKKFNKINELIKYPAAERLNLTHRIMPAIPCKLAKY